MITREEAKTYIPGVYENRKKEKERKKERRKK
jgi:hypothetical protein